MSIKRFFCIVLSAMMVLAIIPAAALANGIDYQMTEAEGMRRWDNVWAVLDPVEAEMMAQGATRAEVTYAVYQAALNCPLIDKGSITDLSDNEFTFTTNGMLGGYNYRVRNFTKAPARQTNADMKIEKITETKGCGWAQAVDVLLVQPYSGFDSSFTQQYNTEAASIAATTGGSLTELKGNNATGPAIAAAYAGKGVVIYDSHGNCIDSKQTSYLDLHTNTGLTTTDYNNGWAYNGGSFYGIDGRYIQNHAVTPLACPIVWMAICEGMKIGGRGTTGTALLAAGAGCVYGYSQSVTFAGDYEMEDTFWTDMKNGSNVADAFAHMVSAHCPNGYDPYGSSHAYPIVMSADDPFPSNPDSRQHPVCDWTLFPQEPVALEGHALAESSVQVYRTATIDVSFNPNPLNANQYELTWGTEDASIATVSGNNRKVAITGVADGNTRIYCDVIVDGEIIGRDYCDVEVLHYPTLAEAANVEGGTLNVVSATSNYPWAVTFDGDRAAVKSGNAGVSSSTSTLRVQIQMQAGDKLKFDWKVSSESNYDKLGFYVNNTQNGTLISGTVDWAAKEYTASSAGTYTFEWRFTKDSSVNSGNDCGYVDNIELVRNITPGTGDVDLNGSVEGTDALLALRYSMGMVELNEEQLAEGDVNGDGVVDGTDALIILRLSMGIN
ncbi:MAG: dockerin type I repeat-containing protein [Clostridia bacterium]|nr:dockerin type I repeat-containing protein [Clostridia bacterium]